MRETFGNVLLCKYSGAVKIIAQIPRLGQKEFTWGGGNGDLTCSCHVPLLCWNFFQYSSYAPLGKCPIFSISQAVTWWIIHTCTFVLFNYLLSSFSSVSDLLLLCLGLAQLWSTLRGAVLIALFFHALSCLFKSFGSAGKALSHPASFKKKKMVWDLWGSLRNKRNRRENDTT